MSVKAKETRTVRRPTTRKIGPWSIFEHLHPADQAYLKEQWRRLPPLHVAHLTPVPPDDDVESWSLPTNVFRFSGKSVAATTSLTSVPLNVSIASTASTSFTASTTSTAPTELTSSTASFSSETCTTSGNKFSPDTSTQKEVLQPAQPVTPVTTITTTNRAEQASQTKKLAEQEQQLREQSVKLQGCTQTITQLEQSVKDLQKQKTEEADAIKSAAIQEVNRVKSEAGQEIQSIKSQAEQAFTSLKGEYLRAYEAAKGEKTRAEQERDDIKTALLQAQQEKTQIMSTAERAYGELQGQVASLQRELSTARQENQVLQSGRDNSTASPSDAVLVDFLLRLIEKEAPQQAGWKLLSSKTLPGPLHDVFRSTLRFQTNISSLMGTVEAYYAAQSAKTPAVQVPMNVGTGPTPQVTGTPKPVVQSPAVTTAAVTAPPPAGDEDMELEAPSGSTAPTAAQWLEDNKDIISNPVKETKQRCRNGSNCPFLKKGTCNYYHLPEEHAAVEKERQAFTITQPQSQRPPKSNQVCKFGAACKYPGDTCPYAHPERSTTIAPPVNTTPSLSRPATFSLPAPMNTKSPYQSEEKKKKQIKLCVGGLKFGGCQNVACDDGHPGNKEYPASLAEKLVGRLTVDLPKSAACSIHDIVGHVAFIHPQELPGDLEKENREVVLEAMQPHVTLLKKVVTRASKESLRDARLGPSHFTDITKGLGLWVDPNGNAETGEYDISRAGLRILSKLGTLDEAIRRTLTAETATDDLPDYEDDTPVPKKGKSTAPDFVDDAELFGQFKTPVQHVDPGFQLEP